NLVANVGWAGLALLGLSLVLILIRAERRPIVTALWLALLGFGLPISLARIDADRYLVPVIPMAILIGVAAGRTLSERAAARWRAGAVAAVVVAWAGPLLARAVAEAAQGSDTTQMEARRWCDQNLRADALLVQEGYAARLPTQLLRERLRAGPT